MMFVIEFFADKIPAFDLIWNALHTFVRVPLAGLLAYAATPQLPLGKQLLPPARGGAIALAAHGGKTAVRAAVTPSPEPFSNITLSLGEDALAIFLTWFATQHAYWAAAIAGVFLVTIIVLVRRWSVPYELCSVPRSETWSVDSWVKQPAWAGAHEGSRLRFGEIHSSGNTGSTAKWWGARPAGLLPSARHTTRIALS